jgi:16S rRNA (uracil1498-N3)-methyltransferase
MSAVGEQVLLDASASHHLLRVTGIAPGEAVELFDGDGRCAEAILVEVRDGLAVLEVKALKQAAARGDTVHLVLAQVRANTLDGVLRMVTELGVSSVQIISTERTVAKGDKRDRWQRIVASAAAQCGRSDMPEVYPPSTLGEVMNGPTGQRLVLCLEAGVVERTGDSVTLLVGPEGGLSEAEMASLVEAGWTPAGLGERTLRADTAAVAAVVKYGGRT